MAEIKIEKKAMVWPWILAGLLIAAVAGYFLFFRNGNDNNTAVADADTTLQMPPVDTQQNNDAVVSYSTFITTGTSSMSLSHSYISEALTRLISATRAVADKDGFDIKADLDKAENDANEITKNPKAVDHADMIKDAATRIGSALQNMQHSKYPSLNMEAGAVASAASNIKPEVLTLDQKETIQAFFDKAANLLQKMKYL